MGLNKFSKLVTYLANESIVKNEGNQRSTGEINREVYEWVEAVVFSLAAVVMLFTFIFRIVGIDGTSMLNTLQDKDRIVISILNYQPKRGDIVVLSTKAVDKPIIKRIIALSGQKVDINYTTHTVYVDGLAQNEPFIKDLTTFQGRDPVKMPVTVPKNNVFVMGDNRNDSLDSRSSEIGMIDTRYILGKAVFRIFPIKSVGTLK
jgi:signal peptidase I